MNDLLDYVYNNTLYYYYAYKDYVYNIFSFPYYYLKYEYFKDDYNVKRYDRNTFLLTYRYNENTYKMLIKHSKLPNNILYVNNHNDEDITESFYEIMGPAYDFHNIKYTPRYFNAKFITIKFMDDKFSIFFEDEVITI